MQLKSLLHCCTLCTTLGKLCIEVTPADKIATISEDLCIGCGICVKVWGNPILGVLLFVMSFPTLLSTCTSYPLQKCPFEAISIINLPSDLEKDTTHRYSANSFKLHRLPIPRQGVVLGLVGTNGIGKSTALKILAGKLKPNLGKFAVRIYFCACLIGQWDYESCVFFFGMCVFVGSTKLAGSSHILQRVRVAEVFHQDPRGWFEGLLMCYIASFKNRPPSTAWRNSSYL